jgi:hypothetical protein
MKMPRSGPAVASALRTRGPKYPQMNPAKPIATVPARVYDAIVRKAKGPGVDAITAMLSRQPA